MEIGIVLWDSQALDGLIAGETPFWYRISVMTRCSTLRTES